MPALVTHRPELQAFTADFPQGRAGCWYRRSGDTLVLHHTEVPPALRGQGVAGEVVAAALAWAREQGLKVRPACGYVAAYMRRHPETQALLA